MENKPKMILEMDEYEKLLNRSKKDTEIATCLITFLVKCKSFGGDSLLYKLQDLMTESGYSIKYSGTFGDVEFGKGDKIILINQEKEVTNG